MQDNLEQEFKDLFLAKTGSTCMPHYNSEQTLNIFGHGFTMSELKSIASFASRLQHIADTILESNQIPDGSIYILKVCNGEVQISFGGLSKK